MATYQRPTSPVLSILLEPLFDVHAGSARRYACTELCDLDFLEAGVLRCVSASQSGRDFLQHHGDHGRRDIDVDLFFKALKSARRLANAESVNTLLSRTMAARCADPYAGIPELRDFDIHAGDGHYHEAACHDGRAPNGKKRAVGHFFALDMRTHHLRAMALAGPGPGNGTEHDMRALKRTEIDALRAGAPKGRRVILVWDRAGIDFSFWERVKRTGGVYFVSREKENMALQVVGNKEFDRGDPRNAGVVSDELVGPGGGGAMLRRVRYRTPDGEEFSYVTTEMTLPPGVIVLLYKQRWDIEKVFDEFKSKLLERKSWASGDTAKKLHAAFLCLAHNLMVLLETEIRDNEDIDNAVELARKEQRLELALKSGADFVATALQRFTVRSVRFVRWLRNFAYRDAPWSEALSRLRLIYSTP